MYAYPLKLQTFAEQGIKEGRVVCIDQDGNKVFEIIVPLREEPDKTLAFAEDMKRRYEHLFTGLLRID